MYDPPGYVWAITTAGAIGFPAATCAVLYGGAIRSGLGRARAALLTGAAAAVLGGWLIASAEIGGHGWYHTKLGHGVPWMPVAVVGYLGLLLTLRQIPAVRRALAAPGMAGRLELPHTFRIAGISFLLLMALGQLPALFALPAGVGDITTGLAAPFVAAALARGTGRRAAWWLNWFGLGDLVLALTLGALTAYQVVTTHPTGGLISELPLVLIPTTGVPLLLTLHITSLLTLARPGRAQGPTETRVPVTVR